MRLVSFVIGLSLAFAALAWPVVAPAQVICISNASPPPELPVYDQPPIPGPGYIWTPGYWAGGAYGYFWVPGTWVEPPQSGLLWTPGYWAWRDGIYIWTAGYWGPQVGFYGDIDYGYGYSGAGYEGGRWEHGAFFYNRNVNNFGGVGIRNVYEKNVIVEPRASRVSFNGGSGGTAGLPTAEQKRAAHQQHIAAIPAQLQHERTASADKSLLASENHGRPAIAATPKPNVFSGEGVVAARDEKARVVPQSVKPGLAPGEKPPGAAVVPPNATLPTANPPKALEENRREVPPAIGHVRPDHSPAPGNAVSPPPPREVNREGKPPPPEVKTQPELKPPPPPRESHAPPPEHVATPTPPSLPRASAPPPAHVVAPTPPPPPRASNVPPPHVAAPPPPPPPHPAPPPKPAPTPEKKPQ